MGELVVALALGAVLGGTVVALTPAQTRASKRSGFWDVLLAEFDRARRYERQFAVARLRLGNDASDVASSLLGRRGGTRAALRSTDHAFAVGHHLYVILPESDRQHAEHWLMRLRHAHPRLETGAVRMVCFPDDGVTTGEVLAALLDESVQHAQLATDARWAL